MLKLTTFGAQYLQNDEEFQNVSILNVSELKRKFQREN